MTSRHAVDAFLAQPAIAVVGASRSGKKFGNIACRELRAKGYRVYPVHWSGATIDGVHSYERLTALPGCVKAALIVVPPLQARDVVRDAAAAGIEHVWLQQGAESPEVLELCRELGLNVVSGECILMFAHPTGIHKVHQVINRIMRRLPAA
jgi:predicted CoA-binding protein